MQISSKEPLLDYRSHRWEAVDANGTMIWMLNTTFYHYVQAWLEVRGIREPSYKQRKEAVTHCRKLSYWRDCKDRDVHFVKLPTRVAH
jgi:hypothetical protein